MFSDIQREELALMAMLGDREGIAEYTEHLQATYPEHFQSVATLHKRVFVDEPRTLPRFIANRPDLGPQYSHFVRPYVAGDLAAQA